MRTIRKNKENQLDLEALKKENRQLKDKLKEYKEVNRILQKNQEIKEELREFGVPSELSAFFLDKDEEASKKSILKFKEIFIEYVEKAVKERMQMKNN